MNNEKIPPHDTEAESAVLSCMLFDKDAISAVQEIISGDDFYRPDNKIIYEAICELFAQNIPVDNLTLANRLSEKGQIEQIGGRDRIINLVSMFYTSVNVKTYANIIAEKSMLRLLIKSGVSIVSAGYEAKDTAETILDHAEKSIYAISNRNCGRDFFHIKDIVGDAVERLEELYNNQGKIIGVETGFIEFDKKTAGLQKSDLILIGARPSMGKTAFLLNIATNAAVKKNIPTIIFSLEMAKESLVNRIISSVARIDAGKMRKGELTDDDWVKIYEAIDILNDAPIFIDDTPSINITQMRSKCRRFKIEKDMGLVIVDYLQLMKLSPHTRFESRQVEVSEISRSLKALAKEFDVPFLVAAQLSRAVDSRKDHRPMLSDLRESGAIEQDADVVAFLYREERYNTDSLKKNHAEVIIAKQRNGPIGDIELVFLGELTKFENPMR